MNHPTELQLTVAEYDKAFIEVSFLLDMFVSTIEAFIGKSTPSLAVAAGRKMAANMPIHLEDPTPENALEALVQFFTMQQMEIQGRFDGAEGVITLDHCPIRSVCLERKMEIDSHVCQMFHYYISGIMAELTGRPVRPRTLAAGERCSFALAFSGARK
jgi:elongation factor P--beta-lysine ligase